MSSKSIVNIIPSFLLRGIDPIEIVKKYNNGEHVKLKKEFTKKIEIKVAPITFLSVNNTSLEEPFYIFNDKNGFPHPMIFSNEAEYQAYKDNKQITRTCQLCSFEFTHEPEMIPIGIEIKNIEKNDTIVRLQIVWGYGVFCHPFHCYTEIKRLTRIPYSFRDLIYKDSEVIYNNVCKDRFPNLKLQEVDIRLLKKFGGTLTLEESLRGDYKYNKSNIYLIVPAKIGHERIHVK